MFRIFILLALIYLGINSTLMAQNVSTLVADQGAVFEAITWSSDGRIFVVDFGSGEVFLLNTDGELTLIDVFPGALGGAMDSAGNFYFSQFGLDQVVKVYPDLSHEVFTEGIDGPAGILISPDDQFMYVTSYNDNIIVRIDMTNENPSPETFADDELINGPDGLVFDAQGDIISVNYLDGNVQRIDGNGTVSNFTSIDDTNSTGYLVNFNGGYLVTGANTSHKIYYITGNGDVSTFGGTGIAGNEDGLIETAQFNFPNGIAISPTGDTLLVAQSHSSGRIRMITNLPTSINEISRTNDLVLAPNPVERNGEMMVRVLNGLQSTSSGKYAVTSVSGVQVSQGILELDNSSQIGTIQLDQIPSGVYVLNVFLEDRRASCRFVIQ